MLTSFLTDTIPTPLEQYRTNLEIPGNYSTVQ